MATWKKLQDPFCGYFEETYTTEDHALLYLSLSLPPFITSRRAQIHMFLFSFFVFTLLEEVNPIRYGGLGLVMSHILTSRMQALES